MEVGADFDMHKPSSPRNPVSDAEIYLQIRDLSTKYENRKIESWKKLFVFPTQLHIKVYGLDHGYSCSSCFRVGKVGTVNIVL